MFVGSGDVVGTNLLGNRFVTDRCRHHAAEVRARNRLRWAGLGGGGHFMGGARAGERATEPMMGVLRTGSGRHQIIHLSFHLRASRLCWDLLRRLFPSRGQMVNGWESAPMTFAAIVPASA
jgi:hypothetical protein